MICDVRHEKVNYYMNEEKNKNIESKDNVKGITAFPVLSEILMPTATLLGKELKDYVKEKIDKIKKQRKAENLNIHLIEVSKKLKEEKYFAENQDVQLIKQINLFEEWVEGAENVDPIDKELSEMWQRILCDIAKDESGKDILLEKLKALKSEDAKLLLEYKRPENQFPHNSDSKNSSVQDEVKERRYRRKKLAELELLEKNEYGKYIIAIATFISVFTVVFLFFKNVPFKNYSNISYIYFVAFISAIIISVFISYRILSMQYKLTWIGEKLVSYVPDKIDTENENTKEKAQNAS